MATLLVWHGYLLGGTGGNIYSADVAGAWLRAGHEVVLMCQDPHPDRHAFVHEWQHVRGGEAFCPSTCSTGTRASPSNASSISTTGSSSGTRGCAARRSRV